ncbi:MAG: ATP synthase subunit I [Aristaeellaceae bacterium]
MKPQEAVRKETGHIAIGTLVMTAVMLAVFAIVGHFRLNVLLGALYGCVLAVANFFFLGITVQRIAESAKAQEDEKQDPDAVKLAKLKMRQSYMLRMLLGAGLLIVALAVLKLNWIACVCPLIFPRITISAMDVFKRVRSVKGSGEIK